MCNLGSAEGYGKVQFGSPLISGNDLKGIVVITEKYGIYKHAGRYL